MHGSMPLSPRWPPSKTIRSRDEFFALVGGFAASPTYIYRGQAKSDWHLEPSIDRGVPGTTVDEERLRQEDNLIAEFCEEARRFLGPPERRFLDDFPSDDKVVRMPVMQHFGGPTRLLDWTHSFPIAAYFACIHDWEADGAICWFDSKCLEERLDGQWTSYGFSSPRNINYNERVFDPSVPRFVGLVVLKIPFLRAQAQRGLFTLGSRLGLLHDDVLAELLPSNKYGRIIIPADLKRDVISHLERIGIDAITLHHSGGDRVGLKMSWKRSRWLSTGQSAEERQEETEH